MSPSCGSREPGMAVLVALCLLRSTSPAAGAYYIRGYEGDECLTPQRVRGVCLVIGKCPSLLNLVSQRPSQQNLAFLNTLRCGFSGSVPIVCCTDGVPGQSTTVQRPPNTSSSSSFTRPATPTRPSSTRLTPTPTHRPAPPAPPVPGDAPPDVSAHPNLRLLPEDYCSPPGIDRIVGGNVTDVFAYPWIARLGYLSRRSTWRPVRYFCGGSLINSRYVLTAAHCIITQTDLYLATVKLGEHTIDKPIDCRPGGACLPPPIDVQVEETKVHSGMDTCPSPEIQDSRKRPLDGDVENGVTKKSHYAGGNCSKNNDIALRNENRKVCSFIVRSNLQDKLNNSNSNVSSNSR